MSLSPSPHWCSPFRQGSSPKYLLVKIRSGSVIFLRLRERSSHENSDPVDSMPQQELSFKGWATDFLLEGVFCAVPKTLTAPIDRVRLVFQTQYTIPRLEAERCRATLASGIVSLSHLQRAGRPALLRGNFTIYIQYFPTQAFNLSFKDSIKVIFPKHNPKQDFSVFFVVNMASVGLAAAGSPTIVYPPD